MNDVTLIDIIIVDDDNDDCLLFKDALDELSFAASLTIIHDGEQLMKHLEMVSANLPDALFLDLNMPRKHGFECLTEIKQHSVFKKIPVIIYSTSYNEEKASQLYNAGAHYYIRKPSDFEELKSAVQRAITLLTQSKLQAAKETFYVNRVNLLDDGKNNF